eukprot:TRINITY_DN28689_c0_g1_i1.p1 TRINITY_DN28689_c0_g1~~TRINITY_DN28689_c0_g1_i1.p1  ORF type:complete len:447 (-),score=68.14 TRINITY_DN28689_c0_g1_i1:329-1669(-)
MATENEQAALCTAESFLNGRNCTDEQIIMVFGILLAAVFICCCMVSTLLFYCRWKLHQPNYGAIVLHSEKSGQKHNVKFRIFKGEELSNPSPQQVGRSNSTLASKTHIVWDVDPKAAVSDSFRSTGQVRMATTEDAGVERSSVEGVDRSPFANQSEDNRSFALALTDGAAFQAESEANDAYRPPTEDSKWRVGGKMNKLMKLDPNSIAGLVHQEAYSEGEQVEYFSTTNGLWSPAKISSAGEFDKEGNAPTYSVTMDFSHQSRFVVPLSRLRPCLAEGEPASYYSVPDKKWLRVVLAGPQRSVSYVGYTAQVLDKTLASGEHAVVPSARIRRRFPEGEQVSVYMGSLNGWLRATVVEDAEENSEEVPGTRSLEARMAARTDSRDARGRVGARIESDAVDPEVYVHVMLDDVDLELGMDGIEKEMKVASGKVRFRRSEDEELQHSRV